MEYLFSPGMDADALIARLERSGWRGEIVGPHGTGKSTLLATLLPLLETRGFAVRRVDLHDGQRWLPRGWLAEALNAERPLVVIDGYEQLCRWERWRVHRAVARHGAGLVVTAHESVGLPSLYTSSVDVTLARRVLRQLVSESCALVNEQDLEAALARHPGDLRSVLFALYDLYEERRRGAKVGP